MPSDDTQMILYILMLAVLVLVLIMAWASHRKLKTQQYYLQALIENEILEDMEEAEEKKKAAAAATTTAEPTVTGSVASLKASGALRGSQGEMCNDLRSPYGGKIYNRDCLTSAVTGARGSLVHSASAIPNINSLIQTEYPKSG